MEALLEAEDEVKLLKDAAPAKVAVVGEMAKLVAMAHVDVVPTAAVAATRAPRVTEVAVEEAVTPRTLGRVAAEGLAAGSVTVIHPETGELLLRATGRRNMLLPAAVCLPLSHHRAGPMAKRRSVGRANHQPKRLEQTLREDRLRLQIVTLLLRSTTQRVPLEGLHPSWLSEAGG